MVTTSHSDSVCCYMLVHLVSPAHVLVNWLHWAINSGRVIFICFCCFCDYLLSLVMFSVPTSVEATVTTVLYYLKIYFFCPSKDNFLVSYSKESYQWLNISYTLSSWKGLAHWINYPCIKNMVNYFLNHVKSSSIIKRSDTALPIRESYFSFLRRLLPWYKSKLTRYPFIVFTYRLV